MTRVVSGVSGQETFPEGCTSRFAELERYICAEFNRLEVTVKQLRAENEVLKGPNRHVDHEVWLESLHRTTPMSSSVRTTPNLGASTRSSIMLESCTDSSLSVAHLKVSLKAVKDWEKKEDTDTHWYAEIGRYQQIARAQWFEKLTIAVILLNLVWIGCDMELLTQHWAYSLVDNAFIIFFLVELYIRFRAYHRKMHVFRHFSFLFDAFLVLIMVLESWAVVIYLAMIQYDEKNDGPRNNASFLRLLRLVRLSRLIRTARAFPELMTMIHGLLKGFRTVCVTMAILGGTTYVFALVFQQLTQNTQVGEKHFGSLWQAFYTLMIVTLLPDNAPLMTELLGEAWLLALLFLIFVFVGALTIMNMLLGVLCDVVRDVAATDKERCELELMTKKIQQILKTVNRDENGFVTKALFWEILADVQTVRCLKHLGVDIVALSEDADSVFEYAQDVKLSVDDFVERLGRFRSNHTATNRSLAGLRKMVRSQQEMVSECRKGVMAILETQGLTRGDARRAINMQTLESARQSELAEHAASLGSTAEEPCPGLLPSTEGIEGWDDAPLRSL